jgi:hypothetical protein
MLGRVGTLLEQAARRIAKMPAAAGRVRRTTRRP